MFDDSPATKRDLEILRKEIHATAVLSVTVILFLGLMGVLAIISTSPSHSPRTVTPAAAVIKL